MKLRIKKISYIEYDTTCPHRGYYYQVQVFRRAFWIFGKLTWRPLVVKCYGSMGPEFDGTYYRKLEFTTKKEADKVLKKYRKVNIGR